MIRISLFIVFLASFFCSNPITPVEKVVDGNTYIAGILRQGNFYTACTWHDGRRTDLLTSELIFINNAKLYNDTFYVAGAYDSSGKMIACYWKQNMRYDLPSLDGAHAKDIDVSNGNVYVVGSISKGYTSWACVWKNGSIVDTFPNSISAYSIYISGNDICIAGSYSSYNDTYACYWLNGVFYKVDSLLSIAYGIIKKDSILYIAGVCESGDNMSACIWKNNERQYVYPDSSSAITSIFFVGDTLVSLGNYHTSNDIKPCYWKNSQLNDFNFYGWVFSLIHTNGGYSFCGASGFLQSFRALYSIHGSVHNLHPSDFEESWCSVIRLKS